MVYTRWKCDRLPVFQLKLFTQEYPLHAAVGILSIMFLWKHMGHCSEETERKHGWWAGYPYWRDPIGRRNEAKYKQLILNNDVDITDPKWTGCSRSCEELKPITEIFPSNDRTFVHLKVRSSKVFVPLRGYGESAVFTYMARLYEHGGVSSIPGPIIHVRAGGKLLLTLYNDLGEQMYEETMESMYSFHDANKTNVHFHGIHGDPSVDDVFKTANPGETIKYNLHIPQEHLPGFHWYHTHAHGSSYLLLMGGLFGPLIVDDTTKQPLSSLTSVVLMIHMYRLGVSTLCDGTPMQTIDKSIKSNMSSNPSIKDKLGKDLELPSDLFLVNGQHKPTVDVAKGQSTILRLAFAAGSCYLNITLPKECDFHISAIDGVPLKVTREVKERWLYFTTATRYDVVVLCIQKQKEELPVVFDRANETIFFIKVVSYANGRTRKEQKLTFPLVSHYDQVNYLLTDRPTFTRDISFSQLGIPLPRPYYVIGQGTNCISLVNSTTCYHEHFTGKGGLLETQYQGFVVPLGGVVEARVFGDPTDVNPHPLHLHVNHFVFLHFTPRKGGLHENASMLDYGVYPGEVRDTIPILDGETVIRWRAASYTGEVVYHCHVLSHGDRGMMRSYLVSEGDVDNRTGQKRDGSSMGQGGVVSNTIASGEKRRAIFSILSIAFFLAAVVAFIVRWFKTNHPALGLWLRGRREYVGTTFHNAANVNELERLHLVQSD